MVHPLLCTEQPEQKHNNTKNTFIFDETRKKKGLHSFNRRKKKRERGENQRKSVAKTAAMATIGKSAFATPALVLDDGTADEEDVLVDTGVLPLPLVDEGVGAGADELVGAEGHSAAYASSLGGRKTLGLAAHAYLSGKTNVSRENGSTSS